MQKVDFIHFAGMTPDMRPLLDDMAARLRPDDIHEVCAASGQDPHEAIYASVTASRKGWLVLLDDRPEILFGVGAMSLLSSTGIPWMLSTTEWEHMAHESLGIAFLRRCRGFVAEMGKGFSRLENYVHAENALSIRWLKWMGFCVEMPAPFGVREELFHRFWKEV